MPKRSGKADETVPNPLDEKVGRYLKNGYHVCSSCRRYEHHSTLFCLHCGAPMTSEKEMTWRRFIREQAAFGSGPLNTFCWSVVPRRAGFRRGVDVEEEKLPAPFKKFVREADQIYERNNYTHHIGERKVSLDDVLYYSKKYKIGHGFKVAGSVLLDYINLLAFRYLRAKLGYAEITPAESKEMEGRRKHLHDNLRRSAGFVPDRSKGAEYMKFERTLDEFVNRKVEDLSGVRNVRNVFNWVDIDFRGIRNQGGFSR